MALTVAKPKAQPKLTVTVNNGGMQGSTYNPQKTAPATVIQNAPNVVQKPTTKPIQGGNASAVQSAATAAQIQAAAAAQAAAVAAAIAEQKRVVRQQITTNISTKTQANKSAFELTVAKAAPQFKLSMGKAPKFKINLPEQSEYDKEYAKAYSEAMKDFDKQRQGGQKNVAQTIWDKVSFGQDRRDASARSYAEKRAKQIMDTNFKGYETKVNAYIKKQAAAQAAINKAATTFKSQAEYEKYVKEQQAILDKEYHALVSEGARYDAQTSAYGNASQRKLTSVTARTLSWAARTASDDNRLWKYTLGSGSKNAPSVVTAPSRVVNWLGNLNTKDRTIYQTGGGSTNRAGSNVNAWQAGFKQRNFNIKPVVDRKFNKDQAYSELRAKVLPGGQMDLGGFQAKFRAAKTDKERDAIAKKYWDDQNRILRNRNSAQEFVADPLFFLGAGKSATKAVPFVGKLTEAAKLSKPAQFASDTLAKIKSTKAVQWLGSEYKSKPEQLQDAIRLAKGKEDELHAAVLPRIAKLNAQLSKNDQLDVSVFDRLGDLTDWEAKVLQRANADGSLSRLDRLRLAGDKASRTRIEGIARDWAMFSEKMAAADKIGSKARRIYAPYTGWISRNGKTLDEYDFRMRKTKNVVQTAGDFRRSAIDRYFKSSVDDTHAVEQGLKQTRRRAERDDLLKRFDSELDPLRANVQKAYEKMPWFYKSSNPAAKVAKFAADNTPTKLWKKSVLKYRPAWYVNNVLYNTQAAALAGGGKALVEQAKMLRPSYYRKAVSEVPESVKSNLAKEIGRDKIARFGNRVENWSRVAAFRGAKSKGLTDDQALRRVNSYLFDYSIKNWERPIRAVVPFWSFQKNLAKASVKMPFDRPLAATGYNRLDTYQQQQFDADFDKTVPKLKELGYTDEEIAKFRQDQGKYYRGKLRVGGKYVTTPFNAFSEKQMSQFGINPFLSAAREVADSTDSFGRPVKGSESSFVRRLISKFPQAELGLQFKRSLDVNSGRLKPVERYIGKAGSEGYGLGKEKQGYDRSKPNYVENMDPRKNLGQNALAFLGAPRVTEFDRDKFVKGKTLQKVTESYFGTNWQEIEDAQGYGAVKQQQEALFKKYGLSADDFYKGILSKYDSENTTRIKGLKEDAAAANQKLFDEYGRQPQGTRNQWAMNKLRELNAAGYFDSNPFLRGFKWADPNSVAKADKQTLVQRAIKSGDWSEYRRIYGMTAKQKDYQLAVSTGDWSKWRAKYGTKSEKARLVQEAQRTGDWSAYRAKYGGKSSPFQYDGKFFKSAESMKKYQDGAFWQKYADASPEARKKLLADNPQYNQRADWTSKQWLDWKIAKKRDERSRAQAFTPVAEKISTNRAAAQNKAVRFKGTLGKRYKKVQYA